MSQLRLMTVMNANMGGQARKHAFEVIDFFDPETRHTAMARTTGFTAAIAARMIANREIGQKEVLFPEQGFIGPRFQLMIPLLPSEGFS